jgi:hypothetical protein
MKKKLDLNQPAKPIVEQAAGEAAPKKDNEQKKTAQENGRLRQDNNKNNKPKSQEH